MSSPKTGEPVTDQSLIRAVFPKDAPKRIARLMAVPLETARHWCYRNLSDARRHELALKLLQQLDEDDRRRQEVRQQLKRIVGTE